MVVLSIIGTRPEAIKMAPVIGELSRYPKEIESLVCVTGQHRELIAPILELFKIKPDHELKVMRPEQSLAELTAALVSELDPIIARCAPRWVLSQGDTTTALAAALTAYYRQVPFGHVEAGLRTGDMHQPFPEEMNRRVADHLAEALFAPTEAACQNLLREGCAPERIYVTGNTSIDALQEISTRPFAAEGSPLGTLPPHKRLVLVTTHRRESFGAPLRGICEAIRRLATLYQEQGVLFLFPVHLNPQVQTVARDFLGGVQNVVLAEPVDYLTMIQAMKRAALIVTDSGGIQEEAPSLGVPVVVVRKVTERPEGVIAGLARLAGTDPTEIVSAVRAILEKADANHADSSWMNPYGDGQAAARIVSVLRRGRMAPDQARQPRSATDAPLAKQEWKAP